MPSNLAPEIIVTVQNPEPDPCESTSASGSPESEDCFNNNASSGNITNRFKLTKLQTQYEKEKWSSALDDVNTAKNATDMKEAVKPTNCQFNKNGKNKLTQRDSKASLVTSIDMVEGKPRLWVSPRRSTSAVRVQVTLHRPLNWQVVPAASASTGSIPTKILRQSSTSSKSTVTHSHSLSQSESLSFSISPSSSILSGPNKKCQSRNYYRPAKGKVRFTNLPRSRLGKHIEKIEETKQGNSVSQSLCFCQCAVRGRSLNDDHGSPTNRSVFCAPSTPVKPENGGGDHNHYVQNSVGAKEIPRRRKKSRGASSRRRTSSYHTTDHQLNERSSSSSDNEGKPKNALNIF